MEINQTKLLQTLLGQWPILQNFTPDVTTIPYGEAITVANVKLMKGTTKLAEIPVAFVNGKMRPPAVMVTPTGPMPITSMNLKQLLGPSPYQVAQPPKQIDQPMTQPPPSPGGAATMIPAIMHRASAKTEALYRLVIIYKDSKGWWLQRTNLGGPGYVKRTWKLTADRLKSLPKDVKDTVLKNGYAVLDVKRPDLKGLKKVASATPETSLKRFDPATLEDLNDYLYLSTKGWSITKKASGSGPIKYFVKPESDKVIILWGNKRASQPMDLLGVSREAEIGKDIAYTLSDGTRTFEVWLSPIYKKASILKGTLLANPKEIQIVPINPQYVHPPTKPVEATTEVFIGKIGSDTWDITGLGRGTYGDAIAIYEWFKDSPTPLTKLADAVQVPTQVAAQMQPQETTSQQDAAQQSTGNSQQLSQDQVQTASSVAQPLAQKSETVQELIAKLQQVPLKPVFDKLIKTASLLWIGMMVLPEIPEDAFKDMTNAVLLLGKLSETMMLKQESPAT